MLPRPARFKKDAIIPRVILPAAEGAELMRETSLVALIAVMTVLLFTSFVVPQVATQRSDQTVIWESISAPEYLDPHLDYETSGAWISWNVYETLFTYDLESDSTEVNEPLLATSYTVSGDGLNYTFHLREGVRFHDGTPFNSTCVKYNFERLLALFDSFGPAWLFAERILGGQAVEIAAYGYGQGSPEHVSNFSAWVEQEPIITLDEYTVRFRLSEPYAPFINVIAHPSGSQISPTYVEKHGGVVMGMWNDWLLDHTCGTGPYMVTNMTTDLVRMDLNLNYWRAVEARVDYPRVGSVNRIYIRVNPSNDNRTANLESGITNGCDWPASQADRVYNGATGSSGDGTPKSLNPNLRVWTGEPTFKTAVLAFYLNATIVDDDRTLTNPFALKELREAVSYAFDYEEYIDNLTGGLAIQLQGPVPLGMFGQKNDLFIYRQNITAAVEKWNEAMTAGLDDALASWNYTLRLRYWHNSDTYAYIIGLVKKGIESILEDPSSTKPSTPLAIDTIGPGMYPHFPQPPQLVYSLGWSPDIADPEEFIAVFVKSTNTYAARVCLGDSQGWNATQVDQWIEQASQSLNRTLRTELYGMIQEAIVKHCAYIYCSQYTNFHVERVEMNGYQFNPMYGPYFYHYWKTEEETSPMIDVFTLAIVAASFAPLVIALVLLRRPKTPSSNEANQ